MNAGNTTPRTFKTKALIAALACVARLIGPTLRYQAREYDLLETLRVDGKGVLLAVYHGTFFPLLWAYRNRGITVLVSPSRDGELITGILEHFGFRCERGSSSRGGSAAVRKITACLEVGDHVAFTIDGPRGPRYRVKPGIVTTAKLTGVPIVPVAVGLSHFIQFRSWDRFRLPLPFSRCTIDAGKPLHVPADSDDQALARYRRALQKRLFQVHRTMHAQAGGPHPRVQGEHVAPNDDPPAT